jgi:hypothetical protein
MSNLIERAIANQIKTEAAIIAALAAAGFEGEKMPSHRGIVVHSKKRGGKFNLNCNGVANALQLEGLDYSFCKVQYSEFYARPFVIGW